MDKLNYPTDEELSFALTGSEAKRDWAIEQIYTRHRKSLFATAYAILRSEQDADDAVQKAFVFVYKRAMSGAWKSEAALGTFLNLAVHSESVNIIRERVRVKRRCDALANEQKGMAPIAADEISSGLSAAEGIVSFDQFTASLSPKEKLVADILGKHWHNHHYVASVKEILERLEGTGATEASVKSIRKRLWPKMAKWIEKAEIL